MASLALNKAALHRERANLGTYRRFLPSLDLKRRQLMADLARARAELSDLEQAAFAATREIGRRLPMLANEAIDLQGLVRVGRLEIAEVNELGVRLPELREVVFRVRPYGRLAKPHWVDNVADELQRMARLRLAIEVANERVRRFDQALRRTTQRVNLFEKVLIPSTVKNIRRIEVFLADAGRAAVVRSKIAKRKHAASRGLAELVRA